MTQDAFELLQAANPLPEDPPPLPIAPLLERVDAASAAAAGREKRGPDRRSTGRFDVDRGRSRSLVAGASRSRARRRLRRRSSRSPVRSSPPENESSAAGPGRRRTSTWTSSRAPRARSPRRRSGRRRRRPRRSRPPPTGIAWKQLGPYNIGGRVTDVSRTLHANGVYAAVSGGGIWKSADGGRELDRRSGRTTTRRRWARSRRRRTARCGPAPARPTRPAAA